MNHITNRILQFLCHPAGADMLNLTSIEVFLENAEI